MNSSPLLTFCQLGLSIGSNSPLHGVIWTSGVSSTALTSCPVYVRGHAILQQSETPHFFFPNSRCRYLLLLLLLLFAACIPIPRSETQATPRHALLLQCTQAVILELDLALALRAPPKTTCVNT